MSQEACGRHRLPLKKEFAPLAGSVVCREPLVVYHPRERAACPKVTLCPGGHPQRLTAVWVQKPGHFSQGQKTLTSHSSPHQYSASKVDKSGQFFALLSAFFYLPQMLIQRALPHKHPIPHNYIWVCFSEEATCDRAKLNTMSAIYQVRSSGSKCEVESLKREKNGVVREWFLEKVIFKTGLEW